MIRMIGALLLSLAVVLALEPSAIRLLHKLHFGQTIYAKMSAEHQAKKGTPTMGGLVMVLGVVGSGLIFHPAQWNGGWDFMIALLTVSVLAMLVGFADDFLKVYKKRSEGLTPSQKLVGQIFVSVAFPVYCYFNPYVGSSIRIPFTALEWDLGIFYIPLLALTIMFMINSANLQDGLDGLMGTVTSVESAGWAGLAMIPLMTAALTDPAEISNTYSIAIFAMALCGASMGFLRFNRYPAKVFMGDTGSMFIGGATVGMAMLLRQPFLLLLISFTMVASSLSVIIQRTYFKLTHGKRIFKNSPIHHHFEMCGYSETQIVSMYGVVNAVLAIVSVLGQIRI